MSKLKRGFLVSAAVLWCVGVTAERAEAALLHFTFVGTAAPGSALDLGFGVLDASGAPFTVTGVTVSDVDLTGVGDGIGQFPATASYDFGGGLVFTTDVGGDNYVQDCAGPAAVDCAGLMDLALATGFLVSFPTVVGDPDFGLPLGSPAPTGLGVLARILTNSAGHLLGLDVASVDSLTVVAVAEPASVLLMSAGLGVLLVRRRRARLH